MTTEPEPGRIVRREVSEETRRRIIEAARGLLTEGEIGAFSMEAVARLAGMSRLTIYYQFGSKRALLEALYDDIAARGELVRLPEVFHASDAEEALRRFVAMFVRFWASDRVLIRKLRALGALDSDFRPAVERDRWRRNGAGTILQRLASEGRIPTPVSEETVDVLSSLTSFETYDALAGETRDTDAVTALVEGTCLRLLGL
jgi:AcrR family transcriptional regulator